MHRYLNLSFEQGYLWAGADLGVGQAHPGWSKLIQICSKWQEQKTNINIIFS